LVSSSGFLTKLNALFDYIGNANNFFSSSGFLFSVAKGLPPGAPKAPNGFKGEAGF
jgi:hypothetical protein